MNDPRPASGYLCNSLRNVATSFAVTVTVTGCALLPQAPRIFNTWANPPASPRRGMVVATSLAD
ncbi:hypothetical protein G5S42_31600 [Paraburkholderia sp. JPY169]|uniref:Uncharacterized protein n=1 Tax=Paraburkholderia youngii TaxID=2782701 RepID=A0A7Y6K4B4_9BURK|nr:hypothetical protein [Paraburkholderia youngii]